MKDITHYPTESLKTIVQFLAKGTKLRRDAIKEILTREKVQSQKDNKDVK